MDFTRVVWEDDQRRLEFSIRIPVDIQIYVRIPKRLQVFDTNLQCGGQCIGFPPMLDGVGHVEHFPAALPAIHMLWRQRISLAACVEHAHLPPRSDALVRVCLEKHVEPQLGADHALLLRDRDVEQETVWGVVCRSETEE